MNSGTMQKNQNSSTAKAYVQKTFIFFSLQNNVIFGILFLNDSLGDQQREIVNAVD